MREDVAQRQADATDPKPTHDKQDIMMYKPGHGSDHNRMPTPTQPQKR